jgi:predicted phage baseplate assembly protein
MSLDTCDCCENDIPEEEHLNRPGLPTLYYRIGTHGSFLRRMLARLPSQKNADDPLAGNRPMLSLTTRSTSDASIALLDAWSCVADVLTFYQERIANEGFLRTAIERRSVLELARAIGYELKPGVAASTYLVFTVEDAPGAPGKANISEGVKVLSIPAQGQTPQTFETVEEIEARLEWNVLTPRQTQPQDLAAGAHLLYLKGTTTGLQPGDPILLVGDERDREPENENWDVRLIKTITTDTKNDLTIITWVKGLGERPVTPAENPRVYAFRLRANLFGHNAAEWDNLHKDIKKLYLPADTAESAIPSFTEWPNFSIQNNQIDLDANYPQVINGSWVVLVRPTYIELFNAKDVNFTSRTGFGLVSKITRVTPDTTENLTSFLLRETTVFAQSQELLLAEEPLPRPLTGDTIPLNQWVPAPTGGRRLIFSGKRMRAEASIRLILHSLDNLRTTVVQPDDSLFMTAAPVVEAGGIRWFLEDRNGFTGFILLRRAFLRVQPALDDDPIVSEVAIIKSIAETEERTTLTLEDPLLNYFDRTTVNIFGNVANATHGESTREVLGSGDGSQANQKFSLKKPPLTYVSAASASGVESTLTVRVNGVAWDQVSSLYGLGPRDKVYTVRLEDDGTTRLIFGDGASGTRLPSGQENISAEYRSGIGLIGEVEADSLALMQIRPFGVRSVINPLPASGAADPESRDEARTNAPITVLTLERIVSRRDFEDFARAFAGVGKAQAVTLWNGETSVMHLTAATSKGEPLDPSSALYTNLHQAIENARDPGLPIILQGFTRVFFRIHAKILVDSHYVFEAVKQEVEAVLLDEFSFARRQFGQPVTNASVIAAMQRVKGLVAVDLDLLHRDGEPASLNPILGAASAARAGTAYYPAELLIVHPFGVVLTEMVS